MKFITHYINSNTELFRYLKLHVSHKNYEEFMENVTNQVTIQKDKFKLRNLIFQIDFSKTEDICNKYKTILFLCTKSKDRKTLSFRLSNRAFLQYKFTTLKK